MNVPVNALLLSIGCLPMGVSLLCAAQAGSEQGEQVPPVSIDETLDRALVELQVAEARGPGFEEAFERARELVDYALDRDKFHRRALYYKARIYILADRGAQALSTLQKWTESPQGENDWEAHFLLGALYNSGGYHKLVKPALRKALALNPREPRIYAELAKCEMHLSNPGGAVQYAREAVAMSRENATASQYALLAEALAADKQLDEADRQAGVAMDLAEGELRNSESSIRLLKRLGESFTLALKIKQAKLDANPTMVELYLESSKLIQERANLSLQLRAHEALDWCERGLEASGDDAPELLLLEAIRLCIRLGLVEKARGLAGRMLELFPDNAEARDLHRALAPPDPDSEAPAKADHVP